MSKKPLERAPEWYIDIQQDMRCKRCTGYVNADLYAVKCRGGMYHGTTLWVEDPHLSIEICEILNANERETVWRRLVNQFKLRFSPSGVSQ